MSFHRGAPPVAPRPSRPPVRYVTGYRPSNLVEDARLIAHARAIVAAHSNTADEIDRDVVAMTRRVPKGAFTELDRISRATRRLADQEDEHIVLLNALLEMVEHRNHPRHVIRPNAPQFPRGKSYNRGNRRPFQGRRKHEDLDSPDASQPWSKQRSEDADTSDDQ